MDEPHPLSLLGWQTGDNTCEGTERDMVCQRDADGLQDAKEPCPASRHQAQPSPFLLARLWTCEADSETVTAGQQAKAGSIFILLPLEVGECELDTAHPSAGSRDIPETGAAILPLEPESCYRGSRKTLKESRVIHWFRPSPVQPTRCYGGIISLQSQKEENHCLNCVLRDFLSRQFNCEKEKGG
ncbi:Hypothetical protein SMAX5B_018978 [Scophthalmus maximus]|uniref:Uncharacterized protein n=1 Tax=Scophthalmus maximus TaxID=52904 RepID=A0A2U9C756_SCOMX|nr:Hypothetical protein SMAX5B_018978 [Scophthalmus maximus]